MNNQNPKEIERLTANLLTLMAQELALQRDLLVGVSSNLQDYLETLNSQEKRASIHEAQSVIRKAADRTTDPSVAGKN